MIIVQHYNKEVLEYWSLLERKLPSYFKGVDCIKPSLLHGDLWAGNASETPDGPGELLILTIGYLALL